ncbi:MAG: hypothetical protein KatS3mg125_0309 [Lysobacterales bacterium]|jgi:uncharacterized protein with beta-barrel porin domain|nr:MAG: hypothetical protein KatS3mg125_0309 [Xanthomonadales bacterium]
MILSSRVWLGVAAVPVLAVAPLAAQTPEQALDQAWVAVCANAPPGTAFAQRCAEILAAGPGSGARRSAAAVGNRLGQLPAQLGGPSERRSAAEGVLGIVAEQPWGLYAVVGGGRHERDGSANEAGFDGDLRQFGLGVDRRFGANWVAGVLVARIDAERRFPDGGGRADSREVGATVYLDGRIGEATALHVSLGWGERELDLVRRVAYTLVLNAGQPNQSTVSISELARARPGGSHTRAGLALQREFAFGANTVSLRLASDYSRVRVDAFTENGGAGLALRRDANRLTSHTLQAGVEFARSVSLGSGVFNPFLRLELVRELESSPEIAVARFAGDPAGTPIVFARDRLDRDDAELSLGAVTVLARGWSLFAQWERFLGNRAFDRHLLSLGLRGEF